MTYEQIVDEYENRYRLSNSLIFKRFLEEFSFISGVNIDQVATNYGVPGNDYMNLFWTLHAYLFNHLPEQIPVFYELLEKYRYNLNADYISMVKLVGDNTENELKGIVKEFIMRTPYIEDISDTNGRITIHSDKVGTISFYSMSKYFSNNYLVKYLLAKFPSTNECHNISWKLTEELPGSTLVTSLIPMPFEGTCYHSVVRDKDGMIVDAANGVVLDESYYHQLFQDEIIVETKDNHLESKLADTSFIEGRRYSSALVLALHEQKKKL